MAKLIFMGEKFRGRIYEFAVEKTTVGRGDHNTLTIHDASVSQSHCEILVYGTEVIVRDLGSRNGTFVSGVRLQNQQKPLQDGQVVKFGSVEARLELMPSPDSDTVTNVTAMHAHARHIREPNEPRSAPVLSPPSPVPAPSGEHTLLLPRQTATPQAPPTTLSSATGQEESHESRSQRGIWLVIAIVVAFALLILAIGILLGRL